MPVQANFSESPIFLQQYVDQGIDLTNVAKLDKNKILLWRDNGKSTTQAYDAHDFVASAPRHGLNSDHYHLSNLRVLDPSNSAATAQYFDVLLTDGLLALIDDLAVGRLQAVQADP